MPRPFRLPVSRRAGLHAAAALALAAALGGVGCSRPEPVAFKGIDITGATYAQTLNLTDASGQPRTLADFKGKVAVVFFGYTQCPDVCPTTLAEVAAAKQMLGAEGSKLVGVFVTVDPERDTPEVLKAYVANFGSDFVALRGSLDETKAIARDFKVFYAKVPGQTEGSYTIDHTANAFVFDPQGRVRLVERYGSGPEALAHDVKALLGGA
ncbi:SCO family protein [Ideonella sp.]|uniref:SCO family protein n=1 Tax=Ideonella sp. TaxID=1929293 RepID=UPI0035B09BFE